MNGAPQLLKSELLTSVPSSPRPFVPTVSTGYQGNIDGDINQNTPLWAPAPPEINVTAPPASGNIHLEPDQYMTVGPDSYGSVNIKSRAELVLLPGVYYFDTLIIEPQASLIAAGPVEIIVRTQLINRGAIVPNFANSAQNG